MQSVTHEVVEQPSRWERLGFAGGLSRQRWCCLRRLCLSHLSFHLCRRWMLAQSKAQHSMRSCIAMRSIAVFHSWGRHK